jgi:ribosomal protein L35AE/L33A
MLKKTYLLWLFGLALLSPNLPAQTDCNNVSQIPFVECEALLALYNSTNGEGWTNNKKWAVTDKPCKWYGVRCEAGHVTWLDLANNQLTGSLPTGLDTLSELVVLELQFNQLSDSIPPDLGNLDNLEHLCLNDNELCGDIPIELMNLNLLSLCLDNNHLKVPDDPIFTAWLEALNPGWQDSQTPCPEPGTLQFSEATYSVDENGGTVTLTVTRVGGSDGVVSVDYATSDDTATAGDDYTAVSGTLNWKDGSSNDKTITVFIVDDTIPEDDETFSLTLSNPTGGATIGDPSTAEVTIIDDDDDKEHGTLQFKKAKYSVDENDVSVEITVTRVGGSDGAVSVKYKSFDSTATAGEDYTKTKGTLKWNDGDASDKTFTVDIIDDSIFETDETFKLKLKKPTGGAAIGDPRKAVVTIIDLSPPASTLQFSSAKYEVGEGGGAVIITVTRVGGSDGAISVKCKSSDGSATAGEDYTKTTKTLKWDDGDTDDKTCTVPIIDDTDVEDDETFNMKLKKPTGGATIGDPRKAVVTIIEPIL